MDIDEDDGYSDDDLDALPHEDFDELQQDAIRSTQQLAPQRRPAHPRETRSPNALPEGLGENLRHLSVDAQPLYNESLALPDYPNQPSSDYGEFDDEMLDGEIFDAGEVSGTSAIKESRAAAVPVGEATQREIWRQQRYAIPQYPINERPPWSNARSDSKPGASIRKRPAVRSATLPIEAPDPAPEIQTDVAALQAQLQELRQERDALALASEAAEAIVRSKTGEISIIRANQAKSEKTFEQRMNALEKLHAEEAARQKVEVDKAIAEKQKLATEKGFLQNDISEGNEQIRALQRAIKAKGKAAAVSGTVGDGDNAPQTPKKNRSAGFGDGFEDDEVQMVSPSKLPYRSKTTTPKAGTKRKRKPVDGSPLKPLQLSPGNDLSDVTMLDQGSRAPNREASPSVSTAENAKPRMLGGDHRLELVQQVLNHRVEPGKSRSFEALAHFAFPTKPELPLSTLFLDQMSTLHVKIDVKNFSVELALIVASLWKRCVDEKYWSPVRLLCDMVRHMFLLSHSAAPSLIDDLVHVVQSTADVNILPRVRRQPSELNSNISTFECLELLSLMADDCSFQKEDITRFWRCMRFDFIAMILSIYNPVEELHMTLTLLETSVLDNTFAMLVPPNDGKQEPSEMNLIDLLTRLLVEAPKPPKEESPYDAVEIAELRLDVLGVMKTMCANAHSTLALASSPHAIGRLVWLMNDEIDALYDYRYGHELKTELVNQATRLLFQLRTAHPTMINMQDKLKVVPQSGGVHKHLIALTRLALSEGDLFEEGIEDDVVDCAYEMLEDLSSPEEAEALREAFSTARSK